LRSARAAEEEFSVDELAPHLMGRGLHRATSSKQVLYNGLEQCALESTVKALKK